ncbi:MAG: methionyl-tRNA formyltransferase [Fidelibacterota bacterium]
MRILFLGTPEFALPSLKHLSISKHRVVGVVTTPDKPLGRGLKIRPSPIKRLAQKLGYPIYQPESLKDPRFIAEIRSLSPDLITVVAFRILPPEVYTLPSRGTVNLHASLLPRYRGAAPINRAIMAGEEHTGVTTIFIEERVDAGNIIMQKMVKIGPEETAGELHDRLAVEGAHLLVKTVELISKGLATARPQNEAEATPAPKIRKDDCRIRWSEDARTIFNLIRGLSPKPGAFTYWRGKLLKLLKAAINDADSIEGEPGEVVGVNPIRFTVQAGRGRIDVLELQLQGGRVMGVEPFLRGHALERGEIFE